VDEEETQLRPRDQLLRDTFTPAEGLLFWTILLTAAVASWVSDPRSFWVLGFFLIVGGFCPIILKTHEHTHPFFIDILWTRFWLLSAPVWLIALQFTAGVLQDPLSQIDIKGDLFLTMKEVNHWLPISVATTTTWIAVLGIGSIYIVAMNLFIVPKSRSFFERLLPWLCLNAVLIAIVGYLQKALGLDSALFTPGTGQSDFFAFFPYDGHWAAFALLWSSACIAMALLTSRYEDGKIFVQSIGPWYLTGGALLGASGFLVQARWPAAILLLTFSVMLLAVAVNFLARSKDPNRMSIALCSALVGIITFAGGIFRAFQLDDYAESASSLRRAAIEMFRDSPLFGWGMDSFAQILPFYADDCLLGTRHDRAASDILQILAEIGIIGCLPLCILIAYLVIRYLRGQHDIHLTNHLMIGCIGCICLACFDSPFMSPAVGLSFFIIFFSALRWADLSRNRVDEVDAKPDLVTHESKRSVPFHTKKYSEKFK
jgi:O-antigen ligase